MANKSNSGRKKNSSFIPAMGNPKNRAFYQQPIKNQVLDKRRKDNAKVKY